ncbi:uncharacterized protein LOC122064256 isoform X1 [Macadamia integrifolia]|uniref:uncharacterized protein LOC122064256 isoform X1 n=1 Tax=Macadamia integrifolia TaxID=60698 RepID=UPI001C4ED0DD|nr:uncharacterized protein LOC122064256 isoform X1 [Macadamia integrifolia]
MVREWSWGGGRSSTTRRVERDTSGCISGVLQLLFDHQFQFPLHQPCFKSPDSFLPEDPTILKGLEAPRNSLESEEDPCMGTLRLSSITKEDDLNLPKMIEIRLGTKGGMEEISSETSTSPVIKTPNLVARLMGLDLLPESSPISSSSSSTTTSESAHVSGRSRGKFHQEQNLKEKLACAAVRRDLRSRKTIHESRSLPDSPRISSARRSSDMDPRLSLQINKENLMVPPEEFTSRNSLSCSHYSTKSRKKEWRQGNENRNPSYYARQIVKQVKESVGRRKMGLDITNTTRNGSSEDIPTIKPHRTRLLNHTKMGDESSPGKHSAQSRSPRLRFLEPENKRVTAPSTSHDQCLNSPSTSASTDNEPQPKAPRRPRPQPSNRSATTKCKKGSSKRFTERLTKPPQITETVRNMREEAFVRATPVAKPNHYKNSKKNPLSKDLVLLGLKKDQQKCSTNQKLVAQSSKQSSQLSSCLSQKYNRQEETEMLARQDQNKGNSNSSSKKGGSAEFRYVKKILRSTGIHRDAFVSITRWFSPYHLLNPLIFHYLENSFPYSKTENNGDDDEEEEEGEEEIDLGTIRHRCNRKLLFQLVDEILVDVLRPYLKRKPWLCSIHGELLPASINKETQMRMTGLRLMELLWSRIQSFPAANCQILQDIDNLVEKDLPDANIHTVLSYSEEGESIVFEIERDILDSLLHEIVATFVFFE